MAPVDVETTAVINRPREAVADFAMDPDNVTRWYANITSVEWETPRPVLVGSRVAFVAQFLGRRLAYTYEVLELEPGHRFVMGTVDGPFPMETTYTWYDAPEGATEMRLRNRGRPTGFSVLFAPFMTFAMRRANRKDLSALKAILETEAGSGRTP